MAATARALPIQAPPLGLWWYGGFLLIGVELAVYAILAIRGLPNFYNGRGLRMLSRRYSSESEVFVALARAASVPQFGPPSPAGSLSSIARGPRAHLRRPSPFQETQHR